MPDQNRPLLEMRELRINFGSLRAVDGISLELHAGETLGLVGESGSGKSVTALSIARLLPEPPARYTGGELWLAGQDILRLPARGLRRLRGGVVSYVFQDPATSLNPVLRVGVQIREVLALHRPSANTAQEVMRLLQLVGIPAPELRIRDYPHQLSGGMQQRLMIAMALASEPKLLVADEPTTALDVTIQAQILDLLRELKRRLRMSILLISHNLGLMAEIADRVAVMYAGQIVEQATATALLHHPRHPYTQALVDSVPELGRDADRLRAIPGHVPRLGAWPAGCRFHPRCPLVQPECRLHVPALQDFGDAHWVRCPATPPNPADRPPCPDP